MKKIGRQSPMSIINRKFEEHVKICKEMKILRTKLKYYLR